MKKKLQKLLKNQKGLTLVELLAVVVILGIIAAIAVPSIANIIDNSKKDAHVANAQQMISAARLAVAANDVDAVDDNKITLDELIKGGYIDESLVDPDTNIAYENPDTASFVSIVTTTETTSGNDKITTSKPEYKVTLKGKKRGITGESSGNLTKDGRKLVK